jgi:hypothetical protein
LIAKQAKITKYLSITRHLRRVMLFLRIFFVVAPMCGTDPLALCRIRVCFLSEEKISLWLAHLTGRFPGSSKLGQLHYEGC